MSKKHLNRLYIGGFWIIFASLVIVGAGVVATVVVAPEWSTRIIYVGVATVIAYIVGTIWSKKAKFKVKT